ncbi:ribonuclease H-like domain-containing protein [Auriculariales sp. MPI-PUGE-AT-0066]|nr:ribonuclease H-like domain-containing protein [Auriculariales sp. MPI-PUGE-AT-0066]
MWCSTAELVSNAVSQLQNSPMVIVDCEGRSIGTSAGALSLVTVGTHDARSIFVFDILSLDNIARQPLIDLLADEQKPKLLWDGRMDSIEFRREFGITLGRAWDLQLVDVNSRKYWGDRSGRQSITQRWHALHSVRHMDLDGVYSLSGLKNVLKDHGLFTVQAREHVDHSRWMERPLPADYLRYAKRDIELIARVYQVFSSRGYMPEDRQQLLEEQSKRYHNIHDGPLVRETIFNSSNILPMDVLNEPSHEETLLKQCDKCSRKLSPASFEYASLKNGRKLSHQTCKVCRIAQARVGI